MVHKSTKTVASIALLLLIGSIAVNVWFFSVTQSHRLALEAEKTAVAAKKAHRDALSALLHTVESTKAERAELSSRIVADDSVINLLSLIETIGKEQGATTTTTSLAATPLGNQFETLEINLNVVGSYSAIMRVLALLENLPYQSSVTSVSIANASVQADTFWNGNFVIKITKFKKV